MEDSSKEKDFTEKYNHLKKTYDLPSLESLNIEFEVIDTLNERGFSPTFSLRYVRRQMVGVLSGWINYLHEFIMPDLQSVILVKESESFDEEQKKKVINLIKELMFINSLSTKLELVMSEEQDAAFIIKYFAKWPELKKRILKLAELNLGSWKKDIPADKESYFG